MTTPPSVVRARVRPVAIPGLVQGGARRDQREGDGNAGEFPGEGAAFLTPKPAPLNTPEDLFANEHLNAVGFFETVQTAQGAVRMPGVPTWFSRTPGRVSGPAPTLGADTAAVLAELDLAEAESR